MTKLIERAARVAAVGVRAVVANSGLPEALHQPVIIYLLVNACNLPGSTAAAVIGCSKQNISKHRQRLEDARCDPGFDETLEQLTDQLAAVR